MKNHEAYNDMIIKYRNEGAKLCINFIQPYILKSDNCDGLCCEACQMLQTIWLMEEYEEPEVDWNKVKVDTPILVRNAEDEPWLRRYFAKYENGRIHAWSVGRTSWTANTIAHTTSYAYAKLAKEEE